MTETCIICGGTRNTRGMVTGQGMPPDRWPCRSTWHDDLCACSIPQGDAGGFCQACGHSIPGDVLSKPMTYAGRKVRPMTADELAARDSPVTIPPVEDRPEALRPLSSSRPDSAEGAAILFEEVRRIAIGFIDRTSEVEAHLNYIIATVYTNLVKQNHPDTQAIVEWMKVEIAKLNDLKVKPL